MTLQDKTPLPPSVREKGGDLAKTAFAAGGLLAAFGVASCCALPVALSMLGISAASLVGIGFLAAEYQQELFYAAVVLLLGAAIAMWRQRRSTTCARPGLDWGSKVAVVLAVGLLVLTFWIEPPV
jgi:mercuric ion transport protein